MRVFIAAIALSLTLVGCSAGAPTPQIVYLPATVVPSAVQVAPSPSPSGAPLATAAPKGCVLSEVLSDGTTLITSTTGLKEVACEADMVVPSDCPACLPVTRLSAEPTGTPSCGPVEVLTVNPDFATSTDPNAQVMIPSGEVESFWGTDDYAKTVCKDDSAYGPVP